MMKKLQSQPNDSDLNIVVVPGRVFEEEKEAEYRKMREDVEKGLISQEELRERNCVHWDDDFELVPWNEKGPMWYE